jgi:hypothetical protein
MKFECLVRNPGEDRPPESPQPAPVHVDLLESPPSLVACARRLLSARTPALSSASARPESSGPWVTSSVFHVEHPGILELLLIWTLDSHLNCASEMGWYLDLLVQCCRGRCLTWQPFHVKHERTHQSTWRVKSRCREHSSQAHHGIRSIVPTCSRAPMGRQSGQVLGNSRPMCTSAGCTRPPAERSNGPTPAPRNVFSMFHVKHAGTKPPYEAYRLAARHPPTRLAHTAASTTRTLTSIECAVLIVASGARPTTSAHSPHEPAAPHHEERDVVRKGS